ncbi:NAD(P)/FAD-dependent oxidoreductase [Microbacterium sp. SSW1-59]|uniref:FAD-dependent oxidoreductase n=1 Tax=Microbacterium xanthum TaxID=3079794 RepID=UPI002AD2389E|nr:NAD(P)/FAD-dependent oxidoreductase [Microbacterium sp. SSW1-59]MDZ8200867.1 NAD(P)/FAD-dependent oxidoreductase [Microbacterium sp. SSW1-59]
MREVIVVGAGPVGMLLAGELARHGVDVELLERRPAAGAGTRAIGIHSPVLAALEASGTTEHLLGHAARVARGEARCRGDVVGVVRFDRLSRRFPFVATLPQAATEAVLSTGAPDPVRGATVTAMHQGSDHVRVRAAVAGHISERDARVVVAATGSGGRDLVYRAGALSRHEYPDRYLMTDATAAMDADTSVAAVHLDPAGVLESFPLPDGLRRFVAWDAAPHEADTPATRAARLREAMAVRGEAQAGEGVTAASAFGVRRVIAPRLRHGRVLSVGDTAHEVSPIGGQGMNLGLLDAVTLAPLLAEWMRTGSPPPRLDAWERRRVRSARLSAAIAAANTALGRPASPRAHRLRMGALRALLASPASAVFAHAYAMGFDADA